MDIIILLQSYYCQFAKILNTCRIKPLFYISHICHLLFISITLHDRLREVTLLLYLSKITESYISMPFKQPIRDMSTVKCIKRSKDKSGEEKIEYLVLFDFVSFTWRIHTNFLHKMCHQFTGGQRVGLDGGDGGRPQGDLHTVWQRCGWRLDHWASLSSHECDGHEKTQ